VRPGNAAHTPPRAGATSPGEASESGPFERGPVALLQPPTGHRGESMAHLSQSILRGGGIWTGALSSPLNLTPPPTWVWVGAGPGLGRAELGVVLGGGGRFHNEAPAPGRGGRGRPEEKNNWGRAQSLGSGLLSD